MPGVRFRAGETICGLKRARTAVGRSILMFASGVVITPGNASKLYKCCASEGVPLAVES